MNVLITAALDFLKAAWPYLVAAALGGSVVHWADKSTYTARYDQLNAAYKGYQAQVADEKAAAAETARKALQDQIDKRLTAEATNGQVLDRLHRAEQDRDAAAADRDFARRLLAAAQSGRALPGDRALPAAADRPGPTSPTPTPGGGSLVTDLGDAATETRGCFERYQSLLDELLPQLQRGPHP